MKALNNTLVTVLIISFFMTLSACSNNKSATSSAGAVENMQKVEMGTIISVKTITLKPEEINSYGNVGVSVGTGGSSGVYGSVDLATIGKLYRNATKPTTAQQFIIKKENGETVAITQPASKEVFKIGDAVKLLIQDGKAKVIH
jgi:outer membrane lipoprotein SlyB